MSFIYLVATFLILYIIIKILLPYNENAANREREKQHEKEHTELINKYRNTGIPDLLLDKELEDIDKLDVLEGVHNYTYEEADALLKSSKKSEQKAKLHSVKREISKKAFEVYSKIPSDNKRQPIPDDVKLYVWNRDSGKCVQCGSNENLEYDHILPFAKGGSNTERNIQLLCEKCNRSKSDNIV